jgi:hypothetical protein
MRPCRYLLVLLLIMSGCKTREATRATTSGMLCHPIVSGCGCAYQCARGLRVIRQGRWQVIHDDQDSRTDEATLEHWCFDDAGHGYPARGAPANAKRCLDVFHDGTGCGGECIPTTEYLGCHATGDRCAR